MSFGVVGAPKTKKALKEMVAAHGADKVMVFDTSMHGNRGTIKLSELESRDVIAGPDVMTKRTWFANFRGGKIV